MKAAVLVVARNGLSKKEGNVTASVTASPSGVRDCYKERVGDVHMLALFMAVQFLEGARQTRGAMEEQAANNRTPDQVVLSHIQDHQNSDFELLHAQTQSIGQMLQTMAHDAQLKKQPTFKSQPAPACILVSC